MSEGKAKKIRVEMSRAELLWMFQITEEEFNRMEAIAGKVGEMPESARKGYEARTAMLYRLMEILSSKVITSMASTDEEEIQEMREETERAIAKYASDRLKGAKA